MKTWRVYKHLIPVLLPMGQITMSGSIYLTIAVAVERYITVCHPFFKVSSVCAPRTIVTYRR